MKKLRLAAEILLLIGILGLSILIYVYRDSLSGLTPATYPGIILLCFLCNVTVFLPAPSLMVVASFSLILNPPLVALCGAIGSSLGELSGYLAGVVSTDLSPRARLFGEKIAAKVKKQELLVFILAVLPLPFFDVAGVYSGGQKMKVWKFYLLCFCGKLIKSLFYAYFYVISDRLTSGAFGSLLPF